MQRLPSSAKELMVDIGVCHYMLIFEDIQGSLTMFDFGPIGGDVHVGGPDLQSPTKQPKSKTVAGEIRTTEVRSSTLAAQYLPWCQVVSSVLFSCQTRMQLQTIETA